MKEKTLQRRTDSEGEFGFKSFTGKKEKKKKGNRVTSKTGYLKKKKNCLS